MTVTIRIKLKEFLESNNLRPLHVERNAREKLGLPLGENTIYRIMAKPEPGKLEMTTMNSILMSLSDMVGRTVEFGEIVEFTPDKKDGDA